MPGGNKETSKVDPAKLVPVELNKIIINELQEEQVIVLREIDGSRKFPIVVGINEAAAIERRLKGVRMPRPLTHELLATVIEKLGATIQRIEIVDLRGSTFYAQIIMEINGKRVEVDSRPSDAIALGAAGMVPIFAAERVLMQVI